MKKLNVVPINNANVVKPNPSPGLFGSLEAIIQSVIAVVILKHSSPTQQSSMFDEKNESNGAEIINDTVATDLAPK